MTNTTMTSLAAQAKTTGGSPELIACIARPSGEGPHPGVVLIHEVFGLDDDAKAQADHLAELGYLVVAPDLYTHGPTLRCVQSTFRSLLRQSGPAFADIEAARLWLTEQSDCTGRVGVIGFCMGGGFALLLAGRGDYAASAVNYGQLPPDPHGILSTPCPIVASYGRKDPSLPGAADKLETWLAQTGVAHDVKEYPEASHSFLRSPENSPAWMQALTKVTGIGPEPASARDAWRRIEAFFGEHLR